MKFILMFLMLSCLSVANAQKAEVLLLDEDIDETELKEDFNVHKGSTHRSSIPDRDQRQMLLSKLSAIEKWDELKKDIFYMDLASKSVSQLKEKYPELKLKEIKMLKAQR
ncbi:MAG: hypothetical protein NDI69_16255 [Bacteriovoracaceae bacterium]|nr:hypothetical protein [Bacteriovoracaceae bacterium]